MFSFIEAPDGCVSTEGCPLPYPFEAFNPMQSDFIRAWQEGSNVLVASPTGSGKTVIAELSAYVALRQRKKAIYLSPLKALTEQKAEEWGRPGHPFVASGLCVCTGDYELNDEKRREIIRSGVILMTSEMLDSRTRNIQSEHNDWLYDVGVVVVDEAHLIDTDRGAAVEAGIIRFCRANPDAVVVLISATLSNGREIGGWLSKLNGKPTIFVQRDYRAVPIERHYMPYPPGRYADAERAKMTLALQVIRQHPEDKFIVFVHSKKAGRDLLTDLDFAGVSAAFHNGDLGRDERRTIEDDFSRPDGPLRVLVSTSTLAYGLNLPARRVIILGVHRGTQEVDALDLIQMIGRAGRKGLDEQGDVYVLLPANNVVAWKQRLETMRPVRSRFFAKETLAFQLVAEVEQGRIASIREAKEWFKLSLASHQGNAVGDRLLAEVLGDMTQRFILEYHERTGELKALPLARVSSLLYFSPYDVAAWAWNISRMKRPVTDEQLAFMLANAPSYGTWTSREHEADMRLLTLAPLERLGLSINPKCLSPIHFLSQHLKGHDVPGEGFSTVRVFQGDSKRLLTAIRMIDGLKGGRWKHELTILDVRLRYGVPEEATELVLLPGIGRKRAMSLLEYGITSWEQVANPLNYSHLLAVFRGSQHDADRALRAAREMVGV